MDRRLELHEKLVRALGSVNVYYQAPPNVTMCYPCIRYQLSGHDVKHADDRKYLDTKKYTVTVIDYDPDSKIPERIGDFDYCSFNRFYTADGLNHFVYELYY